MPTQSRPALLDRVLRPFSKVQPGEGPVALLMLVCVFLILTSYYLMKTAREGLILASGTFGLGGDELKTYANGAMALLFVGIVPAYSRLASRVRRIRLINVSYVVVIACLAVFYVLGRAGVPVGLPFFIWLGLVNVFLIAQFWSYANDLYTEEQGKRLFAIIATGGSLGAIFGPRLATLADTFTVMLIAAGVIVGCLALFNVIERVQRAHVRDEHVAEEPISGEGGFALVVRDRYLLLIGVMLLVLNLVNTTGEYVLSNAVRDHAMQIVPATAHADLAGEARAAAIESDRREVIKAFYADFFSWVNLVAFLIQAFLVSRVIRRIGVRRALFVLPVVAFGVYGAIAMIGGIALVRAAKIAENSTDYSLQNTVRQALFLPTSRAVKYKAKAAIDTFFVRAGDTLSALLVGLGVHQLGLGGRQLALVNMGLVVVWIAISAGIARHHRRLSPDDAEQGEANEAREAREAREVRDVREAPPVVPRPGPVIGRPVTPVPGRS
jgi:AAA family ATP:ADP antiporter